MAKSNLTFNKKGWNEIVKHVIDTDGVDRMKRVAEACNSGLEEEGYLVSTEGDEPLSKRDYTATVITATAEAQADNARHNTLVKNLTGQEADMVVPAPALGVIPYAPKVVRDYLVSVLDTDVRVATKDPADRPEKLVKISTAPTGDGTNLVLSSRRLIIQVSNADESVAGELAETVFAHLKSARYVQGNGLRNVTVVGTPARFDDPDDSTPRFQMTVDVLLRAVT